jgi:hypothetical protein
MYLPIEITNQICDYTNDFKNDTFILQFHNGNPYLKLNKKSNTCDIIQKNIMSKLQKPLINELIKLENMDIFTRQDVYFQYHKYLIFMYKVYFQLNPCS